MKFKSIVSLILIAALSMTLTGCMKNDDADGERKTAVLTEAAPAVIKLGTVGYTNLEPAVNMFNAENKLGIKIEITYYRDGIAKGIYCSRL